MQTRSSRSSVLGKRHAAAEPTSPASSSSTQCDTYEDYSPLTPDSTPNPKRARITTSVTDDDSNKENIPPFLIEVLNLSPSLLRSRSLRRTSTESSYTIQTRRTPRRHASMSSLVSTPHTPASGLEHLSLVTPPPTPPSILQPISTRARALLRATSGTGLAGRQDERDVVRTFLISFLNSKEARHSTLYISGSPGTGKTALTNAILHDLCSDFRNADVTLLTINCMALNNVDALWARLVEALDDNSDKSKKGGKGRKVKETTGQILERLLANRRSKCLLFLDELDHIASSSESLAMLFDMIHTHSSHMRLVGIANTHTLTSSSSSTLSLKSLHHVQTLHFAPYTPNQLLVILQQRLAPLSDAETSSVSETQDKFLPLPTLTLLTKKVAAQTGDVRSVFEVLRGAIDISVNVSSSINPLESPTPAVTPSHVLAALKAYAPVAATSNLATPSASKASNSETITKVRNLGLQARLALLAMLLACKRLEIGLCVFSPSSSSSTASPRSPLKRSHSSMNRPIGSFAGVELNQLHAYYTSLLNRSENEVFTPVSRSEFGDLVNVLETVGLISISQIGKLPMTPSKSGKRGLARSMSFGATSAKGGSQELRFVENTCMEEVVRGLGISSNGEPDKISNVREEEARIIWERESGRIAREATARTGSSKCSEVFDEAMED